MIWLCHQHDLIMSSMWLSHQYDYLPICFLYCHILPCPLLNLYSRFISVSTHYILPYSSSLCFLSLSIYLLIPSSYILLPLLRTFFSLSSLYIKPLVRQSHVYTYIYNHCQRESLRTSALLVAIHSFGYYFAIFAGVHCVFSTFIT